MRASPCQARDAGNNVIARYFAEGEQQNGTALLYGRDRLGSVTDLVDGASGTIEAAYAYDPWGNVTSATGTAKASFGYAGMFADANTGLNLTLYRAYDPVQYRWLSRDPLGEAVDANLYRYVFDNPLNLTDRLGLQGEWGQFTQTFTGDPEPPTPQAAAGMAAGDFAQRIQNMATAAALQCIRDLYGQNFDYYQSAIPLAIREQDPFRSVPAFTRELWQGGVVSGSKWYLLQQADAARSIGDWEGAPRFADAARALGGASDVLDAPAAFAFALDAGAGIDAAVATATSFNCQCGPGQ